MPISHRKEAEKARDFEDLVKIVAHRLGVPESTARDYLGMAYSFGYEAACTHVEG